MFSIDDGSTEGLPSSEDESTTNQPILMFPREARVREARANKAAADKLEADKSVADKAAADELDRTEGPNDIELLKDGAPPPLDRDAGGGVAPEAPAHNLVASQKKRSSFTDQLPKVFVIQAENGLPIGANDRDERAHTHSKTRSDLRQAGADAASSSASSDAASSSPPDTGGGPGGGGAPGAVLLAFDPQVSTAKQNDDEGGKQV